MSVSSVPPLSGANNTNNNNSSTTPEPDLMSNPQFLDLYMQNLELTMLAINQNALSITKMALDQSVEE